MSGNTNSGRKLKPAGEKQKHRVQITLRFSDVEIAQIYARCHAERKPLATWAREIVLERTNHG